MLSWIKTAVGNAHLTIITVLILAIVALGVGLKFSTDATALAQANYHTVVESNKTLQTDNLNLLATIEQQEQEKARLENQLFVLSKVNADYQQQAEVQRTRAQELLEALQQMRVAQDEKTKSWAIASVPDDVKRLLQHAAYCAHRDHRKTDTCQNSPGINRAMPAAPI